jgi:hypothetical protein
LVHSISISSLIVFTNSICIRPHTYTRWRSPRCRAVRSRSSLASPPRRTESYGHPARLLMQAACHS